MSTSDENNDKTQMKPRSTPAVGDVDADKTQLAPEAILRRQTAAEKARLLEQKLALIERKKKARTDAGNVPLEPKTPFAQQPSLEGSSSQVFKPSLGSGVIDSQDPSADVGANLSDKTRAYVRKPVELEVDESSATQFQARPRSEGDVPSGGSDEGDSLNQTLANYRSGEHELLKNRFVLEGVLGAGGMGVVYKATDLLKVEAQDRDPYLAIKVLGEEFKTHPHAFIALQRESRKTQSIAHPNIVNVHDFDRDGDRVFMTMEYLDGKPLDKLISQYKATGLPEEDAWGILEGISAALIHAHGQNIIHSDFKPGNIFVTRQGAAKVFDFGIARAVAKAEKREDSEDDKTVFDAGNLGALTPAYASLEMLEGETPDVRDDIYALGCIAYELFTGEHPYQRTHANDAMEKQLKPRRINNISKRQWRVIERALAFKREDRLASVTDFWTQISAKRRSFTGAIVVAAVLIALTAGLGYQTFFVTQDPGISKTDLMDEVAREYAIEQNKVQLEKLMKNPLYTSSWRSELQDTTVVLKELLLDDPWLAMQLGDIYQLYITKVSAVIAAKENEYSDKVNSMSYDDEVQVLAELEELIESAKPYTQDFGELDGLLASIDRLEENLKARQLQLKALALEEKITNGKKEEERRIIAEKSREFDSAKQNVDDILRCRTTINMRDIDISVQKLRSLNKRRYLKAEGDIVSKLAACISKIGRSFPARAEELKLRALRVFPGNAIIADTKIIPKDPCSQALAGKGGSGVRSTCQDELKTEGERIGRGPVMVVIPGRGSVDTFAIGKYELSHGDFNKFCQNSGQCEQSTEDQRKMPITRIKAAQIKNYLTWLSTTSKRRYRLPSRAEWLYAARAKSSQADSNRNCLLNSRGIKKGGSLVYAEVGQNNAWGLINHLGNARELVADGSGFLALGGSYNTDMSVCDFSSKEAVTGNGDEYTGFRVLREIDNKN